MLRLWKPFFKEDAPAQLSEDLKEYLQPTIPNVPITLLHEFAEANRVDAASKVGVMGYYFIVFLTYFLKGKSPNPVDAYIDSVNPNVPSAKHPPLMRLALHIFSICPNSASVEQLFSSFGLILTKLRS